MGTFTWNRLLVKSFEPVGWFIESELSIVDPYSYLFFRP